MKKENYSKEIKKTKMARAKENVLSVEIQIISSENVRNNQDIKLKRRLLKDLQVIAMKIKRRRQMTNSVLWLKLQMREKLVISKALISSLSSNATLDLVKAQREWKFVLATHSEEAQGVSTRIATLAIRVSSDLI
ncbi:hypothetical protein Tco_1459401 [Tanacetum coccineum]